MKPHRPRVSAWQQAAAHEDAQQALPQPRLHLGDGGGIEPGGGMEDDPACGGRVEHAVDDDTVEVQVGIEAGAEAVDEGDRAEPGRVARTRAVRAQALLHRTGTGAEQRPEVRRRVPENGVAASAPRGPIAAAAAPARRDR